VEFGHNLITRYCAFFYRSKDIYCRREHTTFF